MTEQEAKRLWAKTADLWPRWKTTIYIATAWVKAYATYPHNAVFDALDAYYVDHSGAFEPVLKDILKLADQERLAEKSAAQVEFEGRFFSMTKLEQIRVMRDAYRKQADAAQDEITRAKFMRLSEFAGSHVTRLYALHGEHCPPNFGPNTSRGAAPGTLFKDEKVRKFVEEKMK